MISIYLMISSRCWLNHLPAGAPVQPIGEQVDCLGVSQFGVAMDLEPDWHLLAEGSRVDIVVGVISTGPGYSVVQSSIRGSIFLTDINLGGSSKVTLFGVRKLTVGQQCWLTRTSETVVLNHQPRDLMKPLTVTEVCAGIDAVSEGYRACGVDTVSCVEQNKVFAQWLANEGKQVIHGDISDPRVVATMSHVCGSVLSAGVSCQPWSYLGDQQQLSDERSRSLPGTLRAIHLLQVHLAFLECTPAVLHAPEAQAMLTEFASKTGLVVHQAELSLHKFWPSRRQRWWATISHPSLGLHPIPSIPALAFEPALLHLFPWFMELDEETYQSLRLDDHEMDSFLCTPKGMSEHQVNLYKPLPTATHSWGSQLRGCECGCRARGFSSQRIKEKGLYGQLLPLTEMCTKYGDSIPRMRHLHASEVALANGLCPSFASLSQVSARLGLAAVGQMSSPFQGAWVLANAMQDMQKAGLLTGHVPHPLEIMQNIATSLLAARDQLLQVTHPTEPMQRLTKAVELWGNPDAASILQSTRFDVCPDPRSHKPSQIAYEPKSNQCVTSTQLKNHSDPSTCPLPCSVSPRTFQVNHSLDQGTQAACKPADSPVSSLPLPRRGVSNVPSQHHAHTGQVLPNQFPFQTSPVNANGLSTVTTNWSNMTCAHVGKVMPCTPEGVSISAPKPVDDLMEIRPNEMHNGGSEEPPVLPSLPTLRELNVPSMPLPLEGVSNVPDCPSNVSGQPCPEPLIPHPDGKEWFHSTSPEEQDVHAGMTGPSRSTHVPPTRFHATPCPGGPSHGVHNSSNFNQSQDKKPQEVSGGGTLLIHGLRADCSHASPPVLSQMSQQMELTQVHPGQDWSQRVLSQPSPCGSVSTVPVPSQDDFTQAMLNKRIEFEQTSDQSNFLKGGVPGFHTGTKRTMDTSPRSNKKIKTDVHVAPDVIPPPVAEPVIHSQCNHELASPLNETQCHHDTPVTLLHCHHEPETDRTDGTSIHSIPPANEVVPEEPHEVKSNHNTSAILLHDQTELRNLDPSQQQVAEAYIVTDDAPPMEIKFHIGQTAGQLATAHAKHNGIEVAEWTINTVVGTPVPLSSQIIPGVIYKMDPIDRKKHSGCQAPLPADQKRIPPLQGDTRQALLWQQEGWVAYDEMEFYMQMSANSYPGFFMQPQELVSTPDQHAQLIRIIRDVMISAHESKLPAFAPVLFQGHWFPIAALHQDDQIVLATPPSQAVLLRSVLADSNNPQAIEIITKTIPTKFTADCGFQTVGWMMSCACHDDQTHAVDDHQASHWRSLFQQFLQAKGAARSLILQPLRVGVLWETLAFVTS